MKNKKIILSLERWNKIKKEKQELQMAFEAILAGEIELKRGKTKTFREFAKELCQK